MSHVSRGISGDVKTCSSRGRRTCTPVAAAAETPESRSVRAGGVQSRNMCDINVLMAPTVWLPMHANSTLHTETIYTDIHTRLNVEIDMKKQYFSELQELKI